MVATIIRSSEKILNNIEDVKIEIDYVKNILEIEFFNNINLDVAQKVDYLLITIADEKYSIERAVVEKTSGNKIVLRFHEIIIGEFIVNIEDIFTNKIGLVIGNDPLPILQAYLKEVSFMLNQNIEVSCFSDKDDYKIIIEDVSNEKHKVSYFDEIFFNLLGIFSLTFGSMPYVKYQNIDNYKLYRAHKTVFKKGNSFSHWNFIIANVQEIDWQKTYTCFDNNYKSIGLIIDVLNSVSIDENQILNMKVSTLIQCVDGFISVYTDKNKEKKFCDSAKKEIQKLAGESFEEFNILKVCEACRNSDDSKTFNECDKYKQYKFDKTIMAESIKGMLGRMNCSSMRESLLAAFDWCDESKLLIKKFTEEQLKIFIKRSAATRIMFSHMEHKSEAFSDCLELINALDYYKLLLRILLLHEIQVPLVSSSIIELIDSSKFNIIV